MYGLDAKCKSEGLVLYLDSLRKFTKFSRKASDPTNLRLSASSEEQVFNKGRYVFRL